jgi:electron transfer flavoprotein alpha/beta subunit
MTPGARVSLADVLAAVAAGAGSAIEVSRRTGADPDTAEAALTSLASAGRVRRTLVFAGACAVDGCPSCGSSGGCASAGMGSLVGSGLTAWRVVDR